MAHLACGAPADGRRGTVGARAEPVARELGSHLGVLRGEPRPADLDHRAGARERTCPGATARTIPGLEHQHRAPGVGEVARGAQARKPGACDDGVELGGHAFSGASSQTVVPHVIASHTASAPRAAPW